MNNNYFLKFIDQKDFENHILKTLEEYKEALKPIDLKKFNKNIIDPIKLIFDKNILNNSFEEVIDLEIQRQRDKTNNNSIGYFHQNIFKYIKNCSVPDKGWDVIFTSKSMTYYLEIKNKHNTMNSSSASKTYMKMQNHLLNSKDKEKSICALVEVISKKSQNIPWIINLDGEKQSKNEKLRKISIDKFYELITVDKNSFYLLCQQLPITISKVIKDHKHLQKVNDSVFEEIKKGNKDIIDLLYNLAFSTYEGFN